YENWGNTNSAGQQTAKLGAQTGAQDLNSQGLPEAVRITLMLDSNPKPQSALRGNALSNGPPMVFQTVVRLELADRSQPAASGGNSTQSTPATSGPAPPGT
ncbi:MAG TPA: hypothetical protein VFY06_02595, partial [Verrucomicrobiae bacterium]|nr:hypothetical protein [Verrucomicrobiae bacterium]